MVIDIESAEAPTTCSLWTLGNAVDPIGSAGTYDLFLCVEHPLPWPKDVSDIPALREAATRSPRVRVLAVVPSEPGSPTTPRDPSTVLITSWRRTGTNDMAGCDHFVPAAEIEVALAALIDGDHGTWASSPVDSDVFVCGHGKRDRCCGSLGTRLEAELTGRIGETRIRRCSHTGGHRFAATGISFPEGRMWANLTPEILRQVIGRTGDASSLHQHQRGNTALDEWTQVAERAMFDEVGWSWLHYAVTEPTIDVAPDARSAEISFIARSSRQTLSVTARVAVARKVPVPVCGEAPTDANKTSNEYRLIDLVMAGRS